MLLVADGDNPQRASQAVSAWHDSVVAEIQMATQQAQNTFVYDTHLKALSSRQVEYESKIVDIQNFQVKLEILQGELTDWSSLTEDAQKQVEWELGQLISKSSADFTWLTQFREIPPVNPLTDRFQDWLKQVNYAAELEAQYLNYQLDAVNEQVEQASDKYQIASNKSFGLSSNLVVEQLHDKPPDLYPLRPSGLLILIGGLIGFLLWTALSLLKITQ